MLRYPQIGQSLGLLIWIYFAVFAVRSSIVLSPVLRIANFAHVQL